MAADREKAIQQAVDNHILMERKARAWDELRAMVGRFEQSCPVTVAQMDDDADRFARRPVKA